MVYKLGKLIGKGSDGVVYELVSRRQEKIE